ncbi:MAG: phosphate ABC transporter substrate-binding/OmpA family protein [Deltaproteobacteria bacterium]
MYYSPKVKLSQLLYGAAVSLAMTTPLLAEVVNLKSSDGTVNLSGDLISFDGDIYIIRTDLGDLRIAANRVTCAGEGCPETAAVVSDVMIVGSDTIGEGLMPLLMQGYATYLDAAVETKTTAVDGELVATFTGEQGFGDPIGTYLISASASGDAFVGLLEKTAQIGMASRRITPDEARALRDAGAGNLIDPTQEHILAVDSLVVVVNRQNPITEISVDNLAKIYAGEITNWSQLGGADLPIAAATVAEDSGIFAVFRDSVFTNGTPSMPASITHVANNDEAAAFVNDNPGGITFVGYAFQRGQKPLNVVSQCGIGTTPDAFSVKTEEYALFRRLYLYNRGDLDSELAKNFLAFTTSAEANAVIQQAGFVDLGIESQDLGLSSPRAARLTADAASSRSYEAGVIENLLSIMENAKRLSATFRFRTGSAKLDPRGELDLEQLASYLSTMPAGTEVTFVGFSDEVGEFEPNLGLSKNRAEQVAQALQAIAGDRLANITIKTVGFGETSAASCNNSELGRSINRRVETWITNG